MDLRQYHKIGAYPAGVSGDAVASVSHIYRSQGGLIKLSRGWAAEDLTFS